MVIFNSYVSLPEGKSMSTILPGVPQDRLRSATAYPPRAQHGHSREHPSAGLGPGGAWDQLVWF